MILWRHKILDKIDKILRRDYYVGEYVVCGQYVADYSTTECRTFWPEGLRQLRTELRMYSVRLVYIAMGNCV